jgi:HEPN domain-containing protein
MPPTNFHRWLEKSEHDRLDIRNNLAAAQAPWDIVCFHAQQMAEKCLKAHLVYHGKPVERTHDLIALLTTCIAVTPALSVLEEDCRSLNYYAVSVRYPDDLYEPGEPETRDKVAAAERIREAVLRILVP